LVNVELEKGAGLYQCSGPPNALIDLAQGRPVENLSPGRLGASVVDVVYAAAESAKTGKAVSCAVSVRGAT
jgi:pyruvoyl-dependent arginine decarboxylase (PvlArgDC)